MRQIHRPDDPSQHARWRPSPDHAGSRRDDGTALLPLFLRAQLPWPVTGVRRR